MPVVRDGLYRSTRAALLGFHARHYYGARMTLALLGALDALEAATGRAPSPREVEILFDIFDASHNDKISLREARSALHRGDAHPLIT